MNYSENMNYLLKNFNNVYSQINQLNENQKSDENLIVEKSKNNLLTIKKDGKYIHSKYDPLKEAEKIISDYSKEIENYEYIFFYGVGLGYHIENFIKKYPEKKIILYEPDKEIFENYLKYGNLNKINSKKIFNIFFGISSNQIKYFLTSLLKKLSSNFLILNLPSYKIFFDKNIKEFESIMKDLLNTKKQETIVTHLLQKNWIINSIKNFKKIISSKNILWADKNFTENKPALIVGAGPSLQNEIENLKYIKDNNLAYIFSIGTATNLLLKKNIKPDFAFAYDPNPIKTKSGHFQFSLIKSRKIDDIPLIFGSSINNEKIDNFPGEMFHFLTSEDTISYKLLNPDKNFVIEDASTIAVIALDILKKLKFDPIIFLGLDLAFTDNKKYVRVLSEEELSNTLFDENYFGEKVLTDQTFIIMKKNIEFKINQFNSGNIYNATKGGLKIQGLPYENLENLIKNIINKKIDKNALCNFLPFQYEKNYILKTLNKFNADKNKVIPLIDKIENDISNLHSALKIKNSKKIQYIYKDIDESLGDILNNIFFVTLIFPMNRITYEKMNNSIRNLTYETDESKKISIITESFQNFFIPCKKDFYFIEKIFDEEIIEIKNVLGDNKS